MKILFDAYWWVRGPISNQQVLHQIVRQWLAAYLDDDVILGVRAGDMDAVAAEFGNRVKLTPLRLSPHGISVIFELGAIARREGVDFVVSHNFSPVEGRSAVFLHDVLFLTSPEWFTRVERAYFSLMPLTVRRAEIIFTSSKNEANRIREKLHHPRVVPVGLAVSSELLNVTPSAPRYPLTSGQYVLTVGRLNVRKNLEFTCTAALRSGQFSREVPLVIAGSYQGRATQLTPEIEAGVADGSIALLGHVSTAELSWLYRNARAFVFMSLDEGFGLPPLEALSLGTQVIASDIPVMREILGENATYVNNRSVQEMEETFRVLLDGSSQAPASDAVPTEFTWYNTVKSMRTELQKAVQ